MKIVTSGAPYLDIDAYAGCIAYAELLQLMGEEAQASTTAPLNESITPTLLALGKRFVDYAPNKDDEFVMIDLNVEDRFDSIVKHGTVVEIIDHHPGNEDYWRERIGDKAQIESVGAACTQVFERWQVAGKLGQMDPGTSKLLAAGILDNTLDFNADITNERDHTAYAALADVGSLPDDFPAQYFTECQQSIEADLGQAIKNDTKVRVIEEFPDIFGQLVVWNAQEILRSRLSLITDTLQQMDEDWALNLVSIFDKKSYFITTSPIGQQKLAKLLGVKFENGVATADRLWLRKEILEIALEKTA